MHDMTTEQDVFANCACLKVRRAARAVTRAYDEALRPVGLRATQVSVLVAVAVGGAQSIAALAQSLDMDRTTLTRNLGPLQSEGLVALGEEGWRRSRKLGITEKGRARVRKSIPLWEAAQRDLKRRLGEAAWPGMHKALERLIQAA